MRRVKQIDPGPAQRERHGDLLEHGVVAGALDDRLEVRPEAAHERRIRRSADQGVRVSSVLPGQLADQIPNVRPDAVVVQLAGINGDAHSYSL